MSSPNLNNPIKPIRLAYGEEAQQFGELYVPDDTEAHPVVVLIHGGFWRAAYDLSLMTGLAQDLVQRGFAVMHPQLLSGRDPGYDTHFAGLA